MLICFDKAERHLPDRCLRQFGMHQTIPEKVLTWERKTRGVDGGVDLSGRMESEVSEWESCRFHIVEGEEDFDEGEYTNWYSRITRRLVGRPVSISSEFQRMNAALREIVNVADTLSTHGMDDQQIQSVTRIRLVAHEYFRDHVGSHTLLITNSENGVGGRIRGKEAVRRRGLSKRRRKDEHEEYYPSSTMNNPPLLYSSAFNVDQGQSYHVHDIVPRNLCLPANAGDALSNTTCGVHGMRDYGASGEVDESEYQHAAEEESPFPQQSPLENSEDVTRQSDYSVIA